tara:strand:+ start:447 stop:1082 length:636 start_codon:yes stop_codon:yes gene_type:complete
VVGCTNTGTDNQKSVIREVDLNSLLLNPDDIGEGWVISKTIEYNSSIEFYKMSYPHLVNGIHRGYNKKLEPEGYGLITMEIQVFEEGKAQGILKDLINEMKNYNYEEYKKEFEAKQESEEWREIKDKMNDKNYTGSITMTKEFDFLENPEIGDTSYAIIKKTENDLVGEKEFFIIKFVKNDILVSVSYYSGSSDDIKNMIFKISWEIERRI